MTTWKVELTQALSIAGETFDDIESITLDEAELNQEFDCGYGTSEGFPFTAWTKNTVYFPVVYDGAEWVGHVSRNPDGKPTDHQGGQ